MDKFLIDKNVIIILNLAENLRLLLNETNFAFDHCRYMKMNGDRIV